MIKKYDAKKKEWIEVDETTLSNDTKEAIKKRTESFIRLCRFNQSKPEKMAKALATVHKMYFILNCPLEIDTEARCQGFIRDIVPFSYAWEDRFITDIIKCRKNYMKNYAQK